MAKIVLIAEAEAMIGQIVVAVGTSGMGDGVTVEGVLVKVSPTVVDVPNGKGGKQPYAVNKNTLKLSPKVYN